MGPLARIFQNLSRLLTPQKTVTVAPPDLKKIIIIQKKD